jgi:TP901 family phage tail tape measure protein
VTNRTVAVSLTAQVSNYVASFNQAEQATKKFGSSAEDVKAKLDNQNQAMTQVGIGVVAFGAIAAAAVGLAVAKYAEFDQAMSEVQAATHESTENMALLRDAAVEAGASTVFTAKEAADAIGELAKAGVSTADILSGGLSGALDLASAGGLEVADAAQIAATALTQFNLKGSDVPHVADLLAAGAGKAQGSVDDLSQALNQGGLVASQAGFSIEETTGTLAAFAAAGLLGSDAGTSLKTAILALQNPSTKAHEVMDQYKISVYDANGGMLSFADIANQLQTKLGGLTDEQRNAALATIFGNDAVRAANVLYANGSKGITDWTAKVDDTGFAAETAQIKLNNLNGDIEKLGGAFDTALIKSGSAANDALRFLVQSATELVDAFGSAPPVVQQTALAITAVAAALALAGGGLLVVVPRIAEFSAAMATLSGSSIPAVATAATTLTGAVTKSGTALAATARFLTGPWGVALAAAAVGVQILSTALDSVQASSNEVSNALATATTAAEVFQVVGKGKDIKWLSDVKSKLSNLQDVLNEYGEQQDNVFSRFGKESYFGAFDSLREIGEELAKTASTDLPAAQSAFRVLAAETDGSDESLKNLLDSMGPYKDALIGVAKEQDINVTTGSELENQQALVGLAFGEAASKTDIAAQSYTEAADQAQGLQDQILELIETVDKSNDVGADAVSANAAFQTSLAGISEDVQRQKDAFIQLQKDGIEAAGDSLDGFVGTLDGFSLSLDENTASGASNAKTLTDVASAARDSAQATFEQDQKTMSAKDATDKYVSTLGTSRQALIDTATQNGYTAEQVQALADKVFALPSQQQIDIIAETAQANQQIQHVLDLLNSVPAVRRTSVGVTVETDELFRKADGGAVYGPGGPKDDRVPHLLSNGEHVLTAADVQALGGQAGVYAFRSGLHNGSGYANGGSVGSTRVAVSPQFNVTLSSKGGVDLLQYVDVRIEQADARSNMTSMMGVQ